MSREPVHTEGRRFAGWAVMVVLGVFAMAVVVLLVVQPWPSPGPEELDSTVPEMPGPNTPDVGTPVPLNYHWLSPEGSHGHEAGPRAETTHAATRGVDGAPAGRATPVAIASDGGRSLLRASELVPLHRPRLA